MIMLDVCRLFDMVLNLIYLTQGIHTFLSHRGSVVLSTI